MDLKFFNPYYAHSSLQLRPFSSSSQAKCLITISHPNQFWHPLCLHHCRHKSMWEVQMIPFAFTILTLTTLPPPLLKRAPYSNPAFHLCSTVPSSSFTSCSAVSHAFFLLLLIFDLDIHMYDSSYKNTCILLFCKGYLI